MIPSPESWKDTPMTSSRSSPPEQRKDQGRARPHRHSRGGHLPEHDRHQLLSHVPDQPLVLGDRGRDGCFLQGDDNLVQAGTDAPYRNVYVFRCETPEGQITPVDEDANPVAFAVLTGLSRTGTHGCSPSSWRAPTQEKRGYRQSGVTSTEPETRSLSASHAPDRSAREPRGS
jgi:hypothetical protein